MDKVHACIDGQAHTTAVIARAIWSAQRVDVPLEHRSSVTMLPAMRIQAEALFEQECERPSRRPQGSCH